MWDRVCKEESFTQFHPNIFHKEYVCLESGFCGTKNSD